MKPDDILDMIGDAKGAYVWDAQQVRSGAVPIPKRKLPTKKMWLIAAIVALMLLLMGCTVVYLLRMQDMKVGEYSFYVPDEYDEDGNVIPHETHEPIIQLSLQGTNMEALSEWTAFTNTYDQDLSIASEADRTGSAWDLPDNYHLTYGCYSQEMVDKLNEIVEKYDLKLLSEYVVFNWWESRALLDSLSIDSLLYDDSGAQYWDGDLHLEGTFNINILLTLDMGGWTWEEGMVSYRYSLKDYFDPLTGFMQESQDYQQWDYTRQDGKTVLLVLNEGTARIYADLPDAFVSISLDPVIWVDGEKTPMTKKALEQFAELFDLDVKPIPTTMETVEKYKAEALAKYEADRANAQAEHDAQYLKGHESFVEYRLSNAPNPEELSYILFDVNGDGIEELVINGFEILSIKDGQSYKYCDLTQTGVIVARFRPCEGNIFEVWTEDIGMYQHYFYKANTESAEFITGVTRDSTGWYQVLSDGYGGQMKQITEAEAQAIVDSYTRIDFDWLPLKHYGEPVLSITYEDPYARYIARKLERYDDADTFEYALMDLNGDGELELITRESVYMGDGRKYYALYFHMIKDGELWDIDGFHFTYVCEGGILEASADSPDRGLQESYWEYYRVTEDGLESIERVFQDPLTMYWGHVVTGQEGKTVTEEEAMAVCNSYRRIHLDMKPFTEYPLK